MGNTEIQNILGELTNINLVILGISITIFTVVYSFLVNKRSDLANISEKLSQQNDNPFVIKQRYFALRYIKQFTSINGKVLHVITSSSILFLCVFSFNRFFIDSFQDLKNILFYSFCILTALVIFYFAYVFIDLIRKYAKEISL